MFERLYQTELRQLPEKFERIDKIERDNEPYCAEDLKEKLDKVEESFILELDSKVVKDEPKRNTKSRKNISSGSKQKTKKTNLQ